jgi:hypothetical protein
MGCTLFDRERLARNCHLDFRDSREDMGWSDDAKLEQIYCKEREIVEKKSVTRGVLNWLQYTNSDADWPKVTKDSDFFTGRTNGFEIFYEYFYDEIIINKASRCQIVLWIRDILVRILLFSSVANKMPQKLIFFPKVILLITF